MSKYEKGKVIKGTVTGVENYGIFISVDEEYTGLIHISEISHNFVKNVNDFVKIGDIINVEILDVDDKNNHIKLSIKNIKYKNVNKIRKKRIYETPNGFNTLSEKLPNWIEENLKKGINFTNYIDK